MIGIVSLCVNIMAIIVSPSAWLAILSLFLAASNPSHQMLDNNKLQAKTEILESIKSQDINNNENNVASLKKSLSKAESIPTNTNQKETNKQLSQNYIDNMIASAEDSNKLQYYKILLEALPKPDTGDRKSARSSNDRGLALLKVGDIPNAISTLTFAHNADMSDVEITNNLASAYLQNNDSEKAFEFAIEAIRLKPDRTYAWSDLGRSIILNKYPEQDAINCFLIAYAFSKKHEKLLASYASPADYEEPEVKVAMRKAYKTLSIKVQNEKQIR